MSIQSVAEWITDQNTCFLIGAGCSLCAEKPSIDSLTKIVAKTLPQPLLELLADLKGSSGRPANIEDLINYLLRMQQLADSRKTPFEKNNWNIESIDGELLNIQRAVIEAVGLDWKPSPHHQHFLLRLMSSRPHKPIDVFSLNYDTVLEASLETLKIQYTDGFIGSENAYFEPTVFKQVPENKPFFRIYKLHGSVNWIRDDDDTIRRRPGYSLGDTPRAVVYPAEQKYQQTQYGVYEILMRHFRDRMRDIDRNNKLVVLGYSFRDDHINVAIEDSIRAVGSNLTVHAFVGPEDDTDVQKSRFETIANRCDHRLNFYIGDKHRVGPSLEESGWKEIAAKNLWKFENLVELLTGAGNDK
ncbi:MAG: SIR2 family protein [Thermodesulfobacteriota bacterium]